MRFLKNAVKYACVLSAALLLNACETTPTKNVEQDSTPSEVVKPKASLGPVTINGNCVQKDVTGYADNAKLVVEDNIVKSMDWAAKPRGASCRFELKNFKQVSSKPNIDLQSNKDKKCHMYVWQDERHVTLAVSNCRKVCGANDKVLPVLFEPKSGACKPAGGDR